MGPWPNIGEEDGKENETMCCTNQHDPQVHPAICPLSIVLLILKNVLF